MAYFAHNCNNCRVADSINIHETVRQFLLIPKNIFLQAFHEIFKGHLNCLKVKRPISLIIVIIVG
jgi:hypothetical protein